MKAPRRTKALAAGYLVLQIVLTGLHPATAQPVDYYRRLALDITTEALHLAQQGDVASARQLIHRAHAVDPRSSDVLHFRAFLDRNEPALTAAVQAEFEEALRLNDYRIFDPELSRTYLAQLYLRSGQAHRAADLFSGSRFDPNAPWRYQFLRTQLRVGSRWAAAQLAERLPREHPTDLTIARIVLEREQVLTVDLLQWIERSVALVGPHDPEAAAVAAVILHAIRIASPQHPALQSLVHWYYQFGGTDALPAVLRPEVTTPFGDARATALAAQPLDKEILERLIALGDQTTLGLIPTSAIAVLTPGRDGYVEQFYHIENGNLRLWRQDLDTNGRVDRAVEFDARGNPRRLSGWWAGQIVRVEYSIYPTVQRIWWWRGAHWWLWEVADSIPLPIEGIRWPGYGVSAAYGDRVEVEEGALERFWRATDRFRDFARPLPESAVGTEWEREWGFFVVASR